MPATYLKNVLLFLCFAHCSTHTQEKQIGTAPDALAQKYMCALEKTENAKLVDFANTMEKDPGLFLSSVPAFYSQTCQLPQNHTLLAYAKSPALNFKKCLAYWNLSRKINNKIYLPHMYATLEKMSRPIDPHHNPQEMKSVHEEYLATLVDHPVLVQKATTLFNQEWAFDSLRLDLASAQIQLADLHIEFQKEKNKLALSQQNNNRLYTFESLLDKKINKIRSAIYAITYRKEIAELYKNPLIIITQLIQNNCLEKLQNYMIAFPLEFINTVCKTQNSDGNSLIHEVCISSELTNQQKQAGLCFLEEHGLHINEHNSIGKTPLDLVDVNNTALRESLYRLDAQHSLPKVTNLKKSYDTPPATPDAAPEVKIKRTVSFPFTISTIK